MQSSTGFQVGRTGLVYSSRGNQLFIEITNLEERWRCGIRSFPRLAYDANGQPAGDPRFDDDGFAILGATAVQVPQGEEIRGTCLGPGETGYLPITMTEELAKVTLSMEATSDGLELGPVPSCLLPDSYAYSAGNLSIHAHFAGALDPAFESVLDSGTATVLVLDEESFPFAMFSLARDASSVADANEATFRGSINTSQGTSRSLAVSIW